MVTIVAEVPIVGLGLFLIVVLRACCNSADANRRNSDFPEVPYPTTNPQSPNHVTNLDYPNAVYLSNTQFIQAPNQYNPPQLAPPYYAFNSSQPPDYSPSYNPPQQANQYNQAPYFSSQYAQPASQFDPSQQFRQPQNMQKF